MFQIGHSHWPGCGCEKLRTTKTLQWCIGTATVFWSTEISWPQLLKRKWRDGFLKAKWRDDIKDGRSRHLLPSSGRLPGNRRQQSTSTKVIMILRYSISLRLIPFLLIYNGRRGNSTIDSPFVAQNGNCFPNYTYILSFSWNSLYANKYIQPEFSKQVQKNLGNAKEINEFL